MKEIAKIRKISRSSAITLSFMSLFLIFKYVEFSDPYYEILSRTGAGFSARSGGGSINLIIPLSFELPYQRVVGAPLQLPHTENFTQTCSNKDLEMFIGLSKSSLINFGYPAGSLVLNVGKKPSHSKYSKRVVLEIGENGKVAKAYCY